MKFLKLVPAILLAIAALRGQEAPAVTYPSTATLEYRVPGALMRPIIASGTTRNLTFHAGLLVSSICGKDDRNPTANIDLIQVSCIDFDRLRAIAPEWPWPKGRVTQVLVHVRDGDAVRVTVGDEVQFANLTRDAYGRLIALLQFDGAEHTAVAVKVYKAVPE